MTVLEAKTQQKYEILDYIEVPVLSVKPNSLNPRPDFHFDVEDPEMLALVDSLKTEGQHRPVLLYEQVGHYSLPDKPGHYVLLQGERRWRASKMGQLITLRANVHRVPANAAEELELLSVEDAHKLSWQPYFEMLHAARLAKEYGIPIKHANIAAKTGLSMDRLRMAEKIFALDPSIQEKVAAYEQAMHEQRVQGMRKKHSRLAGSRKTLEFTPVKAALVYDIFEAMRTNLTLMVRDYSDAELQERITAWATNGANVEELTNLLSAIKQTSDNPPAGMLAKVHNMLQNPDTAVKTMVRTMGNSHLNRLSNLAKRVEKTGKDASVLTKKADNFGNDLAVLRGIQSQIVRSTTQLDRLERALNERIRTLDRRG